MRSTKLGFFHDIESPNNHSISWSRRFSWVWKLLIMLFEFQSHEQFVSHKHNYEIESLKSINFGLRSHEHFCRRNFDHEIESLKCIISNFQSPDPSFDLMENKTFDLIIVFSISWKKWLSISWLSISWSLPLSAFKELV